MMIKKRTYQGPKGFTLIEIMVVIAIVGIIAAIAVPQFMVYRQKSYIAALESDAHSFANAQAAYYSEHGIYCATVATLTGSQYLAKLSQFSGMAISAGTNNFTLTVTDATHSVSVVYDSAAGGMQ